MTTELPPASIQWEDNVGELRDPYLVVGFLGWSDAGAISSDTLHYLTDVLRPRRVATISCEPFLNYTLERPVAQIEDGIIHDVESPVIEINVWKNPEGDHDVVLMLGKEPHYAWMTFTSTVAAVMEQLGVKHLFTVGGVQDAISHTALPTVSVVGSSPEAVERAVQLDDSVQTADYYGPISIHSCLVRTCMELGIQAISLWGHTPTYLQKNPRLVARIVELVARAIGFKCTVGPLRQKAAELDRKISEALARDPDLRQLVEAIEEKHRARRDPNGDDNIIRLNDFVRRDPHRYDDR
jgi:proteasome assembly chaperone (PAC2) family protein